MWSAARQRRSGCWHVSATPAAHRCLLTLNARHRTVSRIIACKIARSWMSQLFTCWADASRRGAGCDPPESP